MQQLNKITIPNSVTSIGNFAFSGCSRLTIYAEVESEPSGWDSLWNPSNRPVVWGTTEVKETYTVTFNSNGGTTVSNIVKEDGGQIVSAPSTTKDGYTFEGWYDGENKVTFPYVVTANKTLTAKWTKFNEGDTVYIFYTNGGSSVDMVINLIENSPITVRDGYIFLGWYDNSEFNGKPIAFPYEDKEKDILYAKWISDSENLPLTELLELNGQILFGYLGVTYFENNDLWNVDIYSLVNIVPISEVNSNIKNNIINLLGDDLTNVKNVLLPVGELKNFLDANFLDANMFLALEMYTEITLSNNSIYSSYKNIIYFNDTKENSHLIDLLIGNYKKTSNAIYSMDETELYAVTDKNCVEFIIPNTVTTISSRAFNKCGNLKNIIIPYNVTSIGFSAFSNCKSLKSITFEEGSKITEIGSFAFASCSSLESISIPFGVTSIAPSVFQHCSSLKNVYIPYGVINIGSSAFLWCTNLEEIIIPSSVTNIDSLAFKNCGGLKNITFQEGSKLANIGFEAFSGCKKLTNISIPNSVLSIGYSAFVNCSSLTRVDINDIAAWCKIMFVDNFSNPLYYAKNLYLNGESVTNLVIPEEINVNAFAFVNCSSLENVTLLNGITSIGANAFASCNNLKNIEVPYSVTSIGEDAFLNCINLEKVFITDITAWCKILFGNNDSNPFYYAKSLYLNGEIVTDIVISNDITNIGIAFIGGSSLNSIKIPLSVTDIGIYSFLGCHNLIIYAEAESAPIGWDAEWNPNDRPVIWNCNNNDKDKDGYSYVSEENITYKLKDGKASVLSVSSNFTAVNLKSTVTYKGEIFAVTKISQFAFFGYTKLVEIVIPISITHIESYSIYFCQNLVKITYEGTMQEWNEISKATSWDNNSDNYTVYCSDGSITKK